MQNVLRDFDKAPLTVFVVWEPILVTDWQRPSASVLGRIPDARAIQYWDPSHLLALRGRV